LAAPERVLKVLERNWTMVDNGLNGLDDANLTRIPAEGCNSIAWILWHMNRVLDTFVNPRFQSKPQIWIGDNWYQKFNMSDDPENRGGGWTAQQVVEWKPPAKDTLTGYAEAVKASARNYLGSLTDADLEVVKVIPPAADPRAVGDAMEIMIFDNLAHGGQIAYLRGLHQGMGWM
jgi:hypothetical protein